MTRSSRSAVPPLPSEVLPTELAATRERHHVTQQQLAERLEELGSPIDRSTIGKIESGRRGVAVDELFAFAAALGVPPMSLVVPRSAERMRVAPALEADAGDVMRWARGIRPLAQGWSTEEDRRFFDAMPDSEAEAYRRSANLRSIVAGVANLLMVSSWENEEHRLNGVKNCLAHLARDVQREWEDVGLGGTAIGAVEAQRQLLEAMTAAVYERMEAKD